jgi:hypothetical protein
MAFRIALTQRDYRGDVRLLLSGTTDADVPSLLLAYNAWLLTTGGCVDATMFPWIDDVGEELVREIAGLSWLPVDEAAPVDELLFRIEEADSDFLIETRPAADPRALLTRYLAGGSTQGTVAAGVLATLFLDGSVRQASRYAAACGWGMHSDALRYTGHARAGAENSRDRTACD